MKLDKKDGSSGLPGDILQGVLQPAQGPVSKGQQVGQMTRRGLAMVLSGLMILIPMGQADAFAQNTPPPANEQQGPPPADSLPPQNMPQQDYPQQQQGVPQQTAPMGSGQQPAAQGQPLSADQLDQLVAPIALYPDPLVAQVLAAATYPTQVVDADRWRQSQGNAPAEQIAAGAESHNWDPSVKALTAFPTVLAQMDRNLQWTTDLGNAYYNQPQDVMDSVQAMRQKAQTAGQLRSTPQQTVSTEGNTIAIAPANPTVVYVPVYDPWAVYGSPFPMYPGYYYAPPPGIFWGGLAIGFGLGIGIGIFSHWGWGWGHWGMGWGSHSLFYNHNTYITRSTTVINRGFNRPGGPPRAFAGARGAYARPAGGFNRGAGGFNRGPAGGGGNFARPGAGGNRSYAANRPGGSYGAARPGAGVSRPAANYARPSANYSRPSGGAASAPRAAASRPSGGSSGHFSGGGHASSGGGHASGGGGHAGGGGGHHGR